MQHLDHWYAQSHPDEDFAETFAVWLEPTSMGDPLRRLARRAEARLLAMDRLMRSLANARPTVRSKRQLDPLPRLRRTLGEHYRRSASTTAWTTRIYESDLRNLFSDAPEYAKHVPAARFVRRIRKEARTIVASFTDSYQYTIDQLLEKIVERCRTLNLRLTDSEESTKVDFLVFLTVQTMNYLHSGRHRVAL